MLSNVKFVVNMYESNNPNDSITDIMEKAWVTIQNLGGVLQYDEVEPYLAWTDGTELGKTHHRHCIASELDWKKVHDFLQLMDWMDTDWTWEEE